MALPLPRRAVAQLMNEELARGAGVSVFFTGVTAVFAILATIVAARYLGPEGVGIVALGLLLVEFMSIADNLPTAGFIRDYSHGPTQEKLATVLGTKAALGVGVSLLVAAASPALAVLLRVPVAIPLVFAFIPVASIVSSVAIMSYEARRDMKRRNIPIVTEGVTRLLLYGLIVYVPFLPFEPPTSIAVLTLGASFASAAAGFLLVPGMTLRGFSAQKAREYVLFGLKTQSNGVLQKVVFWCDILIIDIMLGHTLQGLYKTAYALMAYLPLAAGAVGVMLYPSLSAHLGSGRAGEVHRTFSLGWFYTFAVAIPVAAVYLLFPGPIIHVLFGAEFAASVPLLRSLSFVGLIAVALLPFESLFPAMNRPDLLLRVIGLQVVLNVGLDLALIPVMGVTGAVVATGVASASALALAVVLARRHRFPLPELGHLRATLTGGPLL